MCFEDVINLIFYTQTFLIKICENGKRLNIFVHDIPSTNIYYYQ